jgi:hypothetical protein
MYNALGTNVPTFTVMHKPRMTTGVRNDAGIIVCKGKMLVLSVFTKDCPDNRWTPENAGVIAVGRIAKALIGWYNRA